jgi:DNA-binding transcriptional regulator YiaG
MTTPDRWPPDRIRQLRERAGWSQADLAARCGLTVDAIRKWEQGTRAPTGAALMLLDRLAADLPA